MPAATAAAGRAVKFAEALRAAAQKRSLKLRPANHPESLAHLDYAEEVHLKNEALRAFWAHHRLPGTPRDVVPATQPRGYRTTSKRRAQLTRQGLALGFSGDFEAQPGSAASDLDAPEHLAVYGQLHEQLSRPASSAFAAALNYVIVRGSGKALAVILNTRAFDGALVRRGKQLGESLQKAGLGVRAAFLYLDPTESDYYLEARRPSGMLSWKRLFGPEFLEVGVNGRRLRFPPVVFSQVNEAMLPTLIATARELLGPLAGVAMLDLYCGYGLFSVCLGSEAAQTLGIDSEGPAIEAARENARHAKLPRARFLAGRVSGELIATRLRPGERPEKQLLDPPRQGTTSEVIDALAKRRPELVVHVFCGTDDIPLEVERWRGSGYNLTRAAPLDLFPGSANLETLAVFSRS